MTYSPDLNKTVTLSTGKPMHFYFDHPNHNGFTPQDHIMAADYHDRTAKSMSQNPRASLFHFAQRDLHSIAAHGKSTKIGHVPSEAFLSSLPPEKQDFWRKKANDQQALNSKLKSIEHYRLGKVLSEKPSSATSSEKIFNVFNSVKKLNKSRTTDIQLAKRVEMDKNPPQPVLVPQDDKNSIDPEYQDILKTVLAKRRAERHQEGEPTDSESDSGDPRTKISAEQLDAIKNAVANRNRGGNW